MKIVRKNQIVLIVMVIVISCTQVHQFKVESPQKSNTGNENLSLVIEQPAQGQPQVKLNPNISLLAVKDKNKLSVFDIRHNKAIFNKSFETKEGLISFQRNSISSFSKDGSLIAFNTGTQNIGLLGSISRDFSTKIVDINNGSIIEFPLEENLPRLTSPGMQRSIISNNNKYIAIIRFYLVGRSKKKWKLELFDIQTKRKIYSTSENYKLSFFRKIPKKEENSFVIFSEDSNTLIWDFDNEIYLYDISTNRKSSIRSSIFSEELKSKSEKVRKQMSYGTKTPLLIANHLINSVPTKNGFKLIGVNLDNGQNILETKIFDSCFLNSNLLYNKEKKTIAIITKNTKYPHHQKICTINSVNGQILQNYVLPYKYFSYSKIELKAMPTNNDIIILNSASEGNNYPSFKFYNTRTGKVVLTMYYIDGELVTISPNGNFDGTEKGLKNIYWQKGKEKFELSQFFDNFYKPGLLAEVLGGKVLEGETIEITKKIEEFPPPAVKIVSPKIGENLTKSEIEIKIEINDNGGGVDEVKLLHNGKRISEDIRGIKIPQTGDSSVKIYKVSLVKGKNIVTASAFSNGRIESKSYELEVFYKGISQNATSYILVVGIDKYKNSNHDLNYAKADAKSFEKIISLKSKNLFNKIELFEFYNSDASKNNIYQAFNEIAEKSKPEDVFTFYFSGHGSVVDDTYYFVTSENVRLYEKEKLDENAIDIKTFQKKLENIKALKQLIVIDACQSGAATEFFALKGAAEEKALAQLARSAGVHILASTGSEQYATEFQTLGHGVFTYTLLEGLKGKADGSPKDNKITIYELKAYLDDQVPILSKKYKGEAQWPNTFSRGQDFPIIFEK